MLLHEFRHALYFSRYGNHCKKNVTFVEWKKDLCDQKEAVPSLTSAFCRHYWVEHIRLIILLIIGGRALLIRSSPVKTQMEDFH